MWVFVLLIVGSQSVLSQIVLLDEPDPEAYIGGIFEASATIEMNAFNNCVSQSHGKVLLKPAIETQYAINSYNAWRTACKIGQQVLALFGPQVPAVDGALLEMTAKAHIPHLQATWRPPEPEIDLEKDPCFNVSDRCGAEAVQTNSRCCFVTVDFYPDADEVSQVLARVLVQYEWSSFAILYEHDFGLMRVQKMLSTYVTLPRTGKLPLTVRKLVPGENNQVVFKELDEMHESRILLDCPVNNVMAYMAQAAKSNMLNDYQSYILTSLEAHTISDELVDMAELRANVSWLSMFEIEDRMIIDDPLKDKASKWFKEDFNTTSIRLETLLVSDAVTHLSNAASHLRDDIEKEHNAPPSICLQEGELPWSLGPELQSKLLTIRSNGYSGNIEFNEWGRRINYNLHLHQMLNGDDPKTIKTWNSSTNTFYDSTKSESESTAQKTGPSRFKVFIVMSTTTKPYFAYKIAEKGQTLIGNDRFEGYAVDLITEIFKIMNNSDYTFRFEEPPERQNKQGKYDEKKKQWDGLIGALLNKKADLVVCDLTINEERKRFVDFSVPFMSTGISILFTKEREIPPGRFSFLNPYSIQVWLYTATAYLVVSIVLFISSRISPGDWENPQPCEKEPEELENIWNFKNCTWLTMGSIMTQGCDILPKAFGSRWVCGMWWFFAMIVCQTYIAQLAASLTSALAEEPIKNVEDLANQRKIAYGCYSGGSTAQFFARSKDKMYEKMWLNMNSSRPSPLCGSNEEGRTRVEKGKNRYAFFMESTSIEYITNRNCDLTQVGNLLDSKDYGIGMPANSPFRTKINEAILKMQGSGVLNDIKKRWWEERFDAVKCPDEHEKGDVEGDLEMDNLIGAFLVLGVGCVFSVIIAGFEFLDHVRNVVISQRISHKEAFILELKSSLNLLKMQKPVLATSSPSRESSVKSGAGGLREEEKKPKVRPVATAAASFIDLEKMF